MRRAINQKMFHSNKVLDLYWNSTSKSQIEESYFLSSPIKVQQFVLAQSCGYIYTLIKINNKHFPLNTNGTPLTYTLDHRKETVHL